MNQIVYKKEIITVHSYESIKRTIEEMNIMELNSLKDDDFIQFINNTFGYLLKEKNSFIKIYRVHNWIYKNIKYRKDAYDETLISPRIIIYIKSGDCDDFAMLTKTILKYLGVETKYILLG